LNEKIFLCYAREDKEQVDELYQRLLAAGFSPWQDKESLLPGQEWTAEIEQAIRESDFFLACLSRNSIDKAGVIQREIKFALKTQQKKFKGKVYLIPVRLEDCRLPEDLQQFQWVDWFEEKAWEKLFKTIRRGIEQRSVWPKRLVNLFIYERHWPVILPLVIPLLYVLLREGCQDSIRALTAMTGLQVFASATLIISGVLYWAVSRHERRRLWLTGLGAALGILILLLLVLKSASEPKAPPNVLVVSVADFTGADAQTSKDDCANANGFFTRLTETLAGFPVYMQRCYKKVVYDTGMKPEEKKGQAESIAKSGNVSANLVIWGETTRSSSGDEFSVHLLVVQLPLSGDEQFADLAFPNEGDMKFTRHELAKDTIFDDIAGALMIISGLSHPDTRLDQESDQTLDQLINDMKRIQSPAMAFYKGLWLINRARRGSNPEYNLQSAITTFEPIWKNQPATTDPDELDLEWKAKMNQAVAQTLLGRYKKTDARESFERAVNLYAELKKSPPTDDEFETCWIDINHGVALFELGQRTPGEQELRQAREMFEKALTDTNEKPDKEWQLARAITNQYLGSVLAVLGGRTQNKDNLIVAIRKYDSALEVLNEADTPEAWVRAKRNRADARAILANWEDEPEPISKLKEAVSDYRAISDSDAFKTACSNAEQARVYHDWGNALLLLAKRVDDSQKMSSFDEARACFEQARSIRERAGNPAELANTQDDLGKALLELGKSARGQVSTDQLKQAVNMFCKAKEYYNAQYFPQRYSKIISALNQLRGLLPGTVYDQACTQY